MLVRICLFLFCSILVSEEWDQRQYRMFIYLHLKWTTNMCHSHSWQVWLHITLAGFVLFVCLRRRRWGSGKRSCWIRGERWWRRNCFMLNSNESFNCRPSWRKHRKKRRRSEVPKRLKLIKLQWYHYSDCRNLEIFFRKCLTLWCSSRVGQKLQNKLLLFF